MIEGLARVYGRTLTPEAIKVWFAAMRWFSKTEIRDACSKVSMAQRSFPTPVEVQAIIREARQASDAKKFYPYSLKDVKPATPYGHACLAVIQQVLAGDMTGDQGVSRCHELAAEMGVDLGRQA